MIRRTLITLGALAVLAFSGAVSAQQIDASKQLKGTVPKANLPSDTTYKIASGTAALGTSAITSGSCATVVTVTATGAASTDVLSASFNGDVTGVTGYVPSTSGTLTIYAYPTTNTANFKVCNPTGATVTPGAVTLNWRITR